MYECFVSSRLAADAILDLLAGRTRRSSRTRRRSTRRSRRSTGLVDAEEGARPLAARRRGGSRGPRSSGGASSGCCSASSRHPGDAARPRPRACRCAALGRRSRPRPQAACGRLPTAERDGSRRTFSVRAVERRRFRRPPEARPAADPSPRRRPSGRSTDGRRSTEADLDACLRAVTAIAPSATTSSTRPATSTSPTRADGLPRFRVNAFRQRGAISFAFRVIPTDVPRFDDLGLPPGVAAARRGAPRPRARHRRDRLGQDDDARGDGRPHQPHARLAHRHDRGPDRDPPPGSRLRSSTSARSGSTPRASARRSGARSARIPDTILIGELRDAETAQTALQAAESGHLVLSTLHTIDAAETIGRMIEFFPEASSSRSARSWPACSRRRLAAAAAARRRRPRRRRRGDGRRTRASPT